VLPNGQVSESKLPLGSEALYPFILACLQELLQSYSAPGPPSTLRALAQAIMLFWPDPKALLTPKLLKPDAQTENDSSRKCLTCGYL
jgi:hypothetical protein